MNDVTASVRISIAEGIIEISGSEEFVRRTITHAEEILKMYSDLTEAAQEKLVDQAKNSMDAAKEVHKAALKGLAEVEERKKQAIEAISKV